MLDQQVNIHRQMQLYGNMTSVEKAMNRHDLQAYKNYDHNQYSIIPGISSSKTIGQPQSLSPKKMIDPDQKYF